MKVYAIQYLDDDGSPKVAYIRARSKAEAIEKFRRGEE